VLDGVAVPAGQVVQVALAASNRYREAGSGSEVEKPPRSQQAAATSEDTPASANTDAKRSDTSSQPPDDLATFRPQRHLDGDMGLTLLPFGGGERVCLGKALAELEIRLMAVGLLGRLRLQLAPPDQDLSLQLIPSPSPRGGLLVLPLPPPEPQTGTPSAGSLADPSLAD
jgi:cytochrome P450